MRIVLIAEAMYICVCNGVTERQVRQCAAEGACCLEKLAGCLGVGAGCGRCRGAAAEILEEMRDKQELPAPA